MPKFIYYNDTGRTVSIHTATEIHGTECNMEEIKPLEEREFILPEGTYPWVKMWDYNDRLQILVSPSRDDESETEDDKKSKHMGKYPIDFSFSDKETGQKLLDFCEKFLDDAEDYNSAYIMMMIIKGQIKRHLQK